MIALGADHAGYDSKEKLKDHFEKSNTVYKDFGTQSEDSCDYPLIAEKVARSVTSGEAEKGVLICGSGIGMCIAANKVKGVRAAVCNDLNLAKLSRMHNDANIICIGARISDIDKIKSIVKVFLETPFEGGRHQKRVDQIKEIESR